MKTHEGQGTLSRSFRPSWVFAMALGAAIGWGAFILPYDWMKTAGLGGTVLGFLVGGSMITVIALCYGYTVKALPYTGGGVAFALASLGKNHAFVAGWALTLGYSCIVALNASAVTLVFRVTFPGLFMKMPLYTVAGWTIYFPEVILASAFLLVFAWLNIRGNELSGRFQFYAVVVMIASVSILVVSMAIHFWVSGSQMPPLFPSGVSRASAIGAIVSFAPWAYVGFDSIPQLAGEFNFSPKKALSLLLWGVGAATFIYIAMMVSTSIAIGVNYDSYVSNAWPPATAIRNVLGPAGLVLMVLGVSTGVLTGLNGFYTASSRVLLTLGRARMVTKRFAEIDGQTRTPRFAILFVAGVCLISPWFGRAALTWVVDMSSVGITVAYFYTSFCTWKIAKVGHVTGMNGEFPPSRLYQAIGILGCLLSLGFMGLLLFPGSPGSLGKESWIALVVWVSAGVLLFVRNNTGSHSPDEKSVESVILR